MSAEVIPGQYNQTHRQRSCVSAGGLIAQEQASLWPNPTAPCTFLLTFDRPDRVRSVLMVQSAAEGPFHTDLWASFSESKCPFPLISELFINSLAPRRRFIRTAALSASTSSTRSLKMWLCLHDNSAKSWSLVCCPFSGRIQGEARDQLHGRCGDRWCQLPALLPSSSLGPAVHTWTVRLR